MRWVFVLILLGFFVSAENAYAAQKAAEEPSAQSVVQPPQPLPQPSQAMPANPATPSGMMAQSRQAYGQGETPIDLLRSVIPVLKDLVGKLDARFIEKNQDLVNKAQDLIKRGENVIGSFYPRNQ